MVSAGMPLGAACTVITAQLQQAGCPDAAFDAADLCLLITGQQPRIAADTRVLSVAEAAQLNKVVARRASREPLQYIWGRWPFLNFELAVGAGVLCPRADTEVVTELAIQALQTWQKQQNIATPQVLELCGGSGCIGLGIKAFCPSAQITVLEKSSEALPYLRQNAAHALDVLLPEHPAPYITVVEGDLFLYHAALQQNHAQFDLLVSNPPYLTESEMLALQPEVAQEPSMALAAGEDGLLFYHAIAKDYQNMVKPGGTLVLEIGCNQATEVIALLAAQGWVQITCHQDYGKNDRCIIAHRPYGC